MVYDMTRQYEAKILIKNRQLTEYNHTDGLVYLEGRKGSEYELEFINHSYEKIMVVPAVDGLSVIDGETAGLDSDGYVINPKSSIRIPGWRLNNSNVAKFEFGDVESGYSAQTGQGTSNSGVIGFLVFRAKPVVYHNYGNWNALRSATPFVGGSIGQPMGLVHPGVGTSISDYSMVGNNILNISSMSATASASNVMTQNCVQPVSKAVPELSTKFGEQTQFNTTNVSFEKRDSQNPDAVMILYYHSKKTLEKMGIIKKSSSYSSPDAFPRYTEKSCRPPAGWTGNPEAKPSRKYKG